MHETGASLDSIVADMIKEMYRSADAFDAAAASLRSRAEKYGSELTGPIDAFIGAFETLQTGCYTFYVTSPRYGVGKYELEDGSYSIPLGGSSGGRKKVWLARLWDFLVEKFWHW